MVEVLQIGNIRFKDKDSHNIEELARYILEHGEIEVYKDNDFVFEPVEEVNIKVLRTKEPSTKGSL